MPPIELVWGFPGENSPAGRFVIDEQEKSRFNLSSGADMDTLLISKTLHIEPLEMSDMGVYTCKATVPGNGRDPSIESLEDKYLLNNILLDADQPFIGKPFYHGHNEIDISRQQTVTWVFDIQANPDPGFTWMHPTGQELDYNLLEKYEMDIKPKLDQVQLNVKFAELQDTGEYVFNIEVMGKTPEERVEKNISLVLRYHRSPYVELEVEEDIIEEIQEMEVNSLHVLGQEYNLSCVVEGYPLNHTSLRWTFQECTSFTECGKPYAVQPDSLEATDGNVNDDYHYQYTSRMQTVASKSGFFICEMCTSNSSIYFPPFCNYSRTEFFVTEFSRGFEIVGPLENVVEKEHVELICAATVYEYKSVKWFKKVDQKNQKKGGSEWTELVPDSQTYIRVTSSNFSHIAKVIFTRIKSSDSGFYECRATPRNPTLVNTTQTFGIAVLKMIHPSKGKENNMNNTEVTLNTGKKLELNCAATGLPTPVVKWTKDDKEVPKNESIQWSKDGQSLYIQYLVYVHSGEYKCHVANRKGAFSGTMKVVINADVHISKGLVAGIVMGVIILMIISAILCWKVKIYNRKFKELTQAELMLFETGDPKSINPELALDDQVDLLPYEKEYEFDRAKLKLGKQLGAGAFGRVLKAQAFGIVPWERSSTVAVKMVKPHADITYIRALMSELKIMIHLGKHLNILNLLGACTSSLNKRELLVIVEYCRFGNIQKYLLLHRNHFIDQTDPDTGEINFQIGQDIIDGHGSDLAKAREEDEMSTAYAYARRRSSGLTTLNTNGDITGAAANGAEGYVDMNQETEGATSCNANSDSCGNPQRQRPPRQTSVRYIADPAIHARGPKKKLRQQSTVSDYNDGLDQIVLTDMTTVPLHDTNDFGGASRKTSRSMSTSSQTAQGPGWRANFKGDYDLHTVRPICTKDLVCWAYQVARGMDYLASKKVMHGDLACRNILLSADNVVKICDFGLAKDIYKTDNYRKKTDGPLPIKWMAIESLRDRVFSTQSDVWSFGIVLWEMFSMGKTPYPGIDPGGGFYNMLLNGYRMEKPGNCPMIIYRTMSECWDTEPSKRPTFNKLMDLLGDLLDTGERDHYLDLSKMFESTIGRAVGSSVENKQYLESMLAPDFNTQMSVLTGADLAEEEGYLVPSLPTVEEGSAASSEYPTLPADETGYLIPKYPSKEGSPKPTNPDQQSAPVIVDEDEEKVPMLLNMDQSGKEQNGTALLRPVNKTPSPPPSMPKDIDKETKIELCNEMNGRGRQQQQQTATSVL